MIRGDVASTTTANGFLCPHYGVAAVESHTRRPISSDEEARPNSMQHGAARVRVQTQFSIL